MDPAARPGVKPVPFLVAAAILVALVRRRRHLEPTLLVGGLLAALGAAVYGTGLIELPELDEVLKDVGETLGPWTYLLVAVMAFLETGAFVGLLAPGETVILVGGVVAGQGEIDIVALVAIIWVCAVAGDLTSFLVGRRLGRDFLVRHGPKVSISEARLQQTEAFFEQHGGKAIFLGRFVGLIRAVAPFLAGSSGMPLRRFLPYDILGAGVWGTTFAVLGYVFWQSIDRVLELAKRGSFALGTVIVVGYLAVKVTRRLRDPERRAALLARLDRHPVLGPAARRLRGPGRFVWERLTPGQLGLELTTLLAIVAVGTFTCAAYAVNVGPGPFGAVDRRGLTWAADLEGATVLDAARAVTELGRFYWTGAAALLAGALLVRRGRLPDAAALLAGVMITSLVVGNLKDATDRARPLDGLAESASSSYPSGHAANSVAYLAIAVALLHALPGLGARAVVFGGALALTVLVGLSRVQLRVHYLSDVLGGWGAGAAIFAICGVAALIVSHLRQTSGASA